MKALRDIMSKDIVTVTKQDNIYEVAVKMKDNGIGFIPVVEGGKLLGVITDRDLVIRGYAAKHSGSTAVEEVMTSEAVTASPETTVEEAAKLMASRKIRRLPIIEGGRLVGVVAIGDMAIRSNLEDEAGEALAQISEPGKEMAGSVR